MQLSTRFICFLLIIGHAGFAQTYTGTGGVINDDGSINDYTLDINDLTPDTLSGAYGLKSVCLKITHSWISDLDIRLISPSGENIMLTSAMGGDTDDYDNTCFTMTAPVHILRGSPPYADTYRPFTSLGNANDNSSGNGQWILRILDTYAYADGGDVISWSLEFGTDAPVRDPFAGTLLPIVQVTTDDNITIPNEPKIEGYIRTIENTNGDLNFPTDVPSFESNITIEVRGSSSQMFPKKSFSFETQDEDGDDLEIELLGLPKEEDWILYSPYTDKSFLRDALTYELGNKMGRYAPRTVVVELYINGDYHGVYWLEEKIKRDKNRVDIKKLNPADTLGDVLTGGYILKVDRDDGEGTFFVSEYEGSNPEEEVRIVYEDPEGPDLHQKQKDYINGFFHSFEDALYSDDFTDSLLGYRRYVDVGSLVDYFLMCELGHNVDAYRLSTFFYKDRDSVDSLFHLGPLWDFNLAYGNVDYCESQFVEGWAYEHSSACGNTPLWWPRFLEDPYFQDQVKCRYDSLRQTELSTGAILHYVDSLSVYLEESAERNFDRWPILSMYIWPNYFIGNTYAEEVNYLKQWLIGRLEWMDANMPGECLPVSGINEINTSHISLSPNPATQTFTIRIDGGKNNIGEVRIANTSGVECLALTSVYAGEEIDISSLPAGVYFVSVKQLNGDRYQQKLVVQH